MSPANSASVQEFFRSLCDSRPSKYAPVPAHRGIPEGTRDLREHLIKRLRPRGMAGPRRHPRLFHDSQHAPSLAGHLTSATN